MDTSQVCTYTLAHSHIKLLTPSNITCSLGGLVRLGMSGQEHSINVMIMMTDKVRDTDHFYSFYGRKIIL